LDDLTAQEKNLPGIPHNCYLSLGSNLGDRLAYFNQAKNLLKPAVHNVFESSIYETDPWGYLDQPQFLNQVIQVTTSLSPHELLIVIKEIEKKLGREKVILYGPRIIDLDILFFDDKVICLPDLIIPHPAMAERAFILVPLAEIAPDFSHPVLKITVSEMLFMVDQGSVKKYQEETRLE